MPYLLQTQKKFHLKQYLLKWKIVTMSLRPQNIVYNKTHESEDFLVVIDNIGNSDFIHVCNYVDWMATRKIHRKWQRFEELLAVEQLKPLVSSNMLSKQT